MLHRQRHLRSWMFLGALILAIVRGEIALAAGTKVGVGLALDTALAPRLIGSGEGCPQRNFLSLKKMTIAFQFWC